MVVVLLCPIPPFRVIPGFMQMVPLLAAKLKLAAAGGGGFEFGNDMEINQHHQAYTKLHCTALQEGFFMLLRDC